MHLYIYVYIYWIFGFILYLSSLIIIDFYLQVFIFIHYY